MLTQGDAMSYATFIYITNIIIDRFIPTLDGIYITQYSI